MQKDAKRKNAAQPVYKPYLKGTLMSRTLLKRSLKVLGLLAMFAFVGALTSGMLAFGSGMLRAVINAVLVVLGCIVMFNNGGAQGENDVSFGEIALNRLNEGKEVSDRDRDNCYHPFKGFLTALLGAAPFVLVALVYALIVRKQTYTLGVLPSWVAGFESRDEIGRALDYYHESVPAGLADYLRMIVRLMLFPYMNMLGAGDYDRLYFLDRLSPVICLIIPFFYGAGYLRGPYRRALVHGNIRLARRRQNRRVRKEREQRMRKNEKKELI